MGVSENRGTLFGGPYNKGSYYLGYYLRVPYFRKLPYRGLNTITNTIFRGVLYYKYGIMGVEHYLHGGIYLDIKTALVRPFSEIQAVTLEEFTKDTRLMSAAAQLYGWDQATLRRHGPPDYFLTAIGAKRDHIFQGILVGRARHPLLLAALQHCFGPTLVDQQQVNIQYMAFCQPKALF